MDEERTNGRGGAIRRRINGLTIKLEPFSTSLTELEATNVRNTIESLLQQYFFEVQPWAEKGSSSSSSSSGTNDLRNKNDAHASHRSEGSITYVGLAQILENQPTADGGVELTMNGLVYFAEGSQNIPDENELLQTMETQALGNSEVVKEALKDFFPSQQQLVVTVETTVTANPTTAPSAAPSSSPTMTPTVAPTRAATATPTILFDPVAEVDNIEPAASEESPELPTAANNTIVVPPLPDWREDVVVVAATGDLGSVESPSSLNPVALGGGVGVGVAAVALAIVIGLFVVKRRRGKEDGAFPTKDNEYLVGIDGDAEDGFGSTDDWKVNSFEESEKNKEDALKAIEPLSVVETDDEAEEVAPSSPTTMAYLSSFFQKKKQSAAVEGHVEVSSVSSVEESGKESGVNMSNYEFTDDGLSDFDDVVSVQPHLVPLQSLESFEKHHTNLKRQDFGVVKKDQLASAFEQPSFVSISSGEDGPAKAAASPSSTAALVSPTAGDGAISDGDLSYSSSSLSAEPLQQKREHQELLLKQSSSGGATADHHEQDDDHDDRIKYSMMPNPYVNQRRGPFGRGKAVPDRSANCVLKPTDFTAASLARGRTSSGSSLELDRVSTHSSTNSGLGMIPKLSAPSWWAGSSSPPQGNPLTRKRSNGGRKSPAVKEAYQREEELAYSGDEENTFGVPSSDGWDPGDAELSSMGDGITPEEMRMVDFHPQVVNGQVPNDRPGTSPPRSPSKKVEAAKSILQRHMKTSSERPNKNNTSFEAAKSVLLRIKSESGSSSSDGGSGDDFKLGESIRSIDSDMSSEEIHFDSELKFDSSNEI